LGLRRRTPVGGEIRGGGVHGHPDARRTGPHPGLPGAGAPRRNPLKVLGFAGNRVAVALTGPLSVGVPGTVAGLFEAHRRFGRLPWKELVAPAVLLARDGHVLDGVRSRQIGREAERLARFPASRAQLLVNGEVPPAGTRLVQSDLARTLQLIADSGS